MSFNNCRDFKAGCDVKVVNPSFFEMYEPMGATGRFLDSDPGHATVMVDADTNLPHQTLYDCFSETLFTVLGSCSWSLIFVFVFGCYAGHFVFRNAFRRQKTKLMLKIFWFMVKISVFETYRQIKRKLLSFDGKLVASTMLYIPFMKRKQSIAITKISGSTASAVERVVMKRPRVSNMFDATESMEKTTQDAGHTTNGRKLEPELRGTADAIKLEPVCSNDERTSKSPISVAPAENGRQTPSPVRTDCWAH